MRRRSTWSNTIPHRPALPLSLPPGALFRHCDGWRGVVLREETQGELIYVARLDTKEPLMVWREAISRTTISALSDIERTRLEKLRAALPPKPKGKPGRPIKRWWEHVNVHDLDEHGRARMTKKQWLKEGKLAPHGRRRRSKPTT